MRVTKDDERARRVCSLALEFMNAAAPVPSSALARRFYPGLSHESFTRAFARDRAALAACGVVVSLVRADGGESLWAVDERASFAGGAELGALDAAALEVACQPLLDDARFPLADDLRFALAKISRSFAEEPAAAAGERRASRELAALWDALLRGRAAEISYTDARGRASARTVAPYGFFSLRGVLYLVAGRLDAEGRPVEGGTRTYRVDRVQSARVVESLRVEVPADFSAGDWARLPFQMGDDAFEAAFAVPDDRAQELARAARGRGSLERDRDGALVWTVPASSARDAASWAVAQGIRPLRPEGLVRAWRDVLEGALAHAS